MSRRKKKQDCRRCGVVIRPDLDSHATLTVACTSCDGTGQWRKDTYGKEYLCADCWSVVDAALAPALGEG